MAMTKLLSSARQICINEYVNVKAYTGICVHIFVIILILV